MKTYLTLLLALPLYVAAQPTVSLNEFYSPGTSMQVETCAPDTAGAAGANQLWDFSSLSSSTALTISITDNTNPTPFGDANIIVAYPDGTKQYIRETTTDSYLDGFTDGTTGDTTTYLDDALHLDVRPFTYGSTLTDTFRSFTTTAYGAGAIHLSGDGYGTLITPAGTYTNVLRIKRAMYENDTAYSNVAIVTGASTISYLWFDTVHATPLLRIDSVSSDIANTVSVQYYTGATAVPVVTKEQAVYTGTFNDNELIVNGNFDQGIAYQLAVYNITGQKIYETQFLAAGTQQHFNISRQLSPALYLVSLKENNNAGNENVIKVVKQ